DRGEVTGAAGRGRRGGGTARRGTADGDDHGDHGRSRPGRAAPAAVCPGGPGGRTGVADTGADRAAGRPGRPRGPARGRGDGDRHPRRVPRRGGAPPVDAGQGDGTDGGVRGGMGRGGTRLRAQPGQHVPAGRARRGPGRDGGRRGAADRPGRIPVRGAVPPDGGYPRPPRRHRRTRCGTGPRRHRTGGRAAAGRRDVRCRPAGRLRGLWRVRCPAGGRRMSERQRANHGLSPALLGERPPAFHIEPAGDAAAIAAYRALRIRAFVEEQRLFAGHDGDERDEDPRTVVLVARDRTGTVVGGVRLGPVGGGEDLGWWTGSRLAIDRAARGVRGVGAALVRAACAWAENAGVLRFEATVQARNEVLFTRLGWHPIRPSTVAGAPHVLMRWPIERIATLATATNSPLGPLLAGCAPGGGFLGGVGFIGDDGAPIPGTDIVAACDAILPSIVERDPEWAGWCGVLVNLNDLAAMGAMPMGLLDALGA